MMYKQFCAVRKCVFRRCGITLIPMPLRTSQQGFKLLKEPFGTNRVYLVFNLGASPNQKLIPLCRLTAFRARLPSSRGHLARGGSHVAVEPRSRNSTPRKHRSGQPKSPCRHPHFHRGLRAESNGSARRCAACLVPLAGLDAQAVAQELSRGLIHTGVAAREYPPRPCELWVCGFSPCRRRAVWFPEPVYSCGLRGCTG